MISPLIFDKVYNLPPQQFKVAMVNIVNELIEQVNREQLLRLEAEKKLVPEKNKGGRPSGKARKVV